MLKWIFHSKIDQKLYFVFEKATQDLFEKLSEKQKLSETTAQKVAFMVANHL